MSVLGKVEKKVDEMFKHARIFAETVPCSLERARFTILAQRIAALELGESVPIEVEPGAALTVEPQPVVAAEPPPPTQRQFAEFVANLNSSGNLTDNQKIVFAWLKFKADGGHHG